MKNANEKPKVNIVTLGCSKNIVDSEKLSIQLQANNLDVVFDQDDYTDTVIINTCGFIHDAKEESINTILSFAEAKKNNRISNLFVVGCLSQRYKESLEAEIPEVDAFLGVDEIARLLKFLHFDFKKGLLNERLLSTPKHYAYLKIAEGCDRNCSFCAIPLIRGKHHSLSIDSLTNEAQKLADKGVKELLLISQDLTYYGYDTNKKSMLAPLLESLLNVQGIEWIRLHYLYPKAFPFDILDIMKSNKKICNYIDIPFQHVSDKILKSMKRGHDAYTIYKLINTFREKIPGVALRTTLITGYPGEAERDFKKLEEFVSQEQFDRLGVFAYSHEEDTPAYKLEDNVSEKEKKERVGSLMELQEGISLELNKKKTGKTLKTIIDREEGDYYIGRSQYDSPEVDNEILVHKNNGPLKVGNFYETEITGADVFDLYATPIKIKP